MNGKCTARAAVMVGPGRDLELREYPVPRVAAGETLVRLRCCTICRSDLHTWMGRRPGPIPAILGHEMVGEIVELGADPVRAAGDLPLQVGDRVTWTMTSSCGQCFYCREKSLPMKCRHLRKYGHDACDRPPHLRGGFAEFCLLDRGTSVVRLPRSLADAVAAPANCAVATIVAGWEAAGVGAQENVLIQGAGALGCYAAAYAAHAGCDRVIVMDVNQERLQLIRQFGATDTIHVAGLPDEAAADHVRELTGGFGADCALEVAGEPAVIPLGLAALRKGGRYVEIGCTFPAARVTLDMSLILWNLLSIRGVHNYAPRHLRQAVQFLAATAGRFPYERLVSKVYALSQINEALRCAESRGAIRVAVAPDEMLFGMLPTAGSGG